MNLRHPLVITIAFAIILCLIGVYIVEKQRAVAPTGTSDSFGAINGGYVVPTESQNPSAPDTSLRDTITEASGPDTLVIPKASSTPAKVTTKATADGSFDYNAILAQLRHDRETPSQQAQSTFDQLSDAFAFTPATPAPVSKVKTAEQQAIFEYGNTIGARIQSFAAVNPNMSQILTDQIKNRGNPTYGDPLKGLGQRYVALGEGILAIQNVPSAVASAHQKLGESYVQLGEGLAKVPDAADDKAFIAAITSYNNKADAFTGAFVGMVTLFSALNVTFESTDAGSVFSFKHN